MGFRGAFIRGGVLALLAGSSALAQFINPFPGIEVELLQSDMRAMQDSAMALLNAGAKPGSDAAWENGETGRKGTVTMMAANTNQGLACHNVRYTIPVPTPARVRDYTLNWCKTPEGWRIGS